MADGKTAQPVEDWKDVPQEDWKDVPAPAPQKSFNEKLTEWRPLPEYDPQHPIASTGRKVLGGLGNIGAGTITGLEGLAGIPHMLMHPGDIPRETAEGAIGLGQDVQEGRPEYAAGKLLGMYLGGKALGAIPGAPEVVERVGGKIGEATREPGKISELPMGKPTPGKLKPWVRTASQIGGAGAGALGGGFLGSIIGPESGGFGTMSGAHLGYKAGPGLADAVLPPHPNPIGWTPKISSTMPEVGGIPPIGSAAQEAGYYPPVTKVPIRPTPPYKVTPESIPGPDTAGKGNLLTPGAKAGDPRLATELVRRGRKVLYVPAEEYPEPRSKQTF